MSTLRIALISLLLLSSYAVAENTPASPKDIEPIKVGEKTPSVAVTNVDDKEIALEDALSVSPTVLIFYRGSW